MKRYEAISAEARALKRLDIVDLIQEITMKLPMASKGGAENGKKQSQLPAADAGSSNGAQTMVTAVMKDIQRKVDKLLVRKDYENAVWFVEEYSGAYSDETASLRKALVRKIKTTWKNDPNPLKTAEPRTSSSGDDSDDTTTKTVESEKTLDNALLSDISELLSKNSIDFDTASPSKLLIKLIKTRIPKRTAKKLAVDLQTLVDQADEKDFTRTSRDLLDALVGFCKRNTGGSLGFEFRASPPKSVSPSNNLAEIFNSAGSGDRIKLSSGTFTLESANISSDNVTITAAEGAIIEGCDLSVNSENCAFKNLRFKDSRLRFFKSNNSSMTNCVLENSKLTLVKSNNFKMTNTFLTSATLDNSNGFKAVHCTFASNDEEVPALKIDTDDLFITNSIIYSKGYAVVVTRKRSNKKCLVTYSILFGEKGFCMRETESDEPKKGDLALKKTKVKLFLKVKHNIYTEPSFQDPWKGDWNLENSATGKKGASDKKECGVIWP